MSKSRRITDSRLNPEKTSKFFITLNTNKPCRSVEYANVLMEQLQDLFDNQIVPHLADYLIVYIKENGHERQLNGSPEDFIFTQEDVDYTIEIGDKQHRLHLHGIITFKHDSRVNLKFNLTKLRRDLPPSRLYIYFIPDATFNILKYIKKSL